MRIAAAFLADFANVRESIVNVVGAGVNRLTVAKLPAPVQLSVVLLLDVAVEELDVQRSLSVEVSLASNKEVVSTGSVLFAIGAHNVEEFATGRNGLMVLPIDLRAVGVTHQGWHKVALALDDGDAYDLHFQVTQVEPELVAVANSAAGSTPAPPVRRRKR